MPSVPLTLEAPARESAKPSRIRKPVEVPPILLEGDTPIGPPESGPGERYALGPKPAILQEQPTPRGELPEAYGTGKLFLAARDPHWLYAAWDLTPEQRQQYNSLSKDGHLVVRVFVDGLQSTPFQEVHVQPDSKSWFIHVKQGETRYVAELGYYNRVGRWSAIATSASTVTPPESASPPAEVAQFATIPQDVSLEKLVEAVQEAVAQHPPLMEAFQQLQPDTPMTPLVQVPPAPATQSREHHQPDETMVPRPIQPVPSVPEAQVRPAPVTTAAQLLNETLHDKVPLVEVVQQLHAFGWNPIPGRAQQRAASTWTPTQASALAKLVRLDGSRRVWMGSLEITELIRRHLQEGISSLVPSPQAPAPEGVAAGPAPGPQISSPSGGEFAWPESGRKGFWLRVNAELVIYGATEPDAKVSVDGRPIRLRQDGTFSYRFALPDGQYPLSIAAVDQANTDRRSVRLEFSRRTARHGEVGAHPQDPSLKPPDQALLT